MRAERANGSDGVRISVIVPAYNATATLGDCLRALVRQTVPGSDYEIIVVDDGSTDGTAGVAASFAGQAVRVIRQAHRGPSAARNHGIRAARGRLLFFTDADCEPAPDWIEAMAAPFADPTVAGAKGVYRTRQRGWLPRFVQAEYEDKYRGMAGAARIDFVDTYSAAYLRCVLEDEALDEGPFDEGVIFAEDAELSFRLAQRGYKLVFNPAAGVYHRHGETLRHYLRRKFGNGQWRVEVYRRYPRKLRGDSHTPEVLRGQLALAALTLAGLVTAPFFAWGRGLGGVAAVAFVASAAPFAVRTWPADRAAAVIAPVLLWLRALALGLGLAYGLALHAAARLKAWVVPAQDVRSEA